ncbi:MAG TPA: flagellar basal body P-ring protein FlgI [Thermodesulfatator sp.]|nr:flagellar basal body P-ring protein FlgI [Thermodesulfatator sp.]
MKRIFILFTVLGVLFLTSAEAARLKDLANIQGVRSNQLIGYGLVVGLKGTGDGNQTQFTVQSIVNMLKRLGVTVDMAQVKVKNVAAVMVTAELPAFAKVGQKLDVLVSSLGDAKSLQGGTLLLTPLKGADGQVYALAQGPISIGGFAAGGAAGGGVQKNHPTAGRIPGGATVEREVPVDLLHRQEITLALRDYDFTTVTRATEVINAYLGAPYARALDGKTISVRIPDQYRHNIVGFIAELERLEVNPDTVAKVVLDERTGTVVMGENVRISKVAIAHGNLSIQIKERPRVSQPPPFSPGATVVVPESQVSVTEEGNRIVVLEEGASIGELVRALNAVGATPRDLIAIFQAIKAAGALQAELKII